MTHNPTKFCMVIVMVVQEGLSVFNWNPLSFVLRWYKCPITLNIYYAINNCEGSLKVCVINAFVVKETLSLLLLKPYIFSLYIGSPKLKISITWTLIVVGLPNVVLLMVMTGLYNGWGAEAFLSKSLNFIISVIIVFKKYSVL